MWKPTSTYSYYQRPHTSDELYHFGILGMKWGKKNGPPYPLDAADHSKSEKEAGYQKSIEKGSGSKSVERKSDEENNESSISTMSDIEKKHGITKKDVGDGYYYGKTKHGFYIFSGTGDDYSPSPKEIDDAIDKFSKADHKEIFEECKKNTYDSIVKYGGEDIDYNDFSKKFDRDYEVQCLWVYKGGTAEVDIELKPDVYVNDYLGDHQLSGEYDVNDFKKHPKSWAMNG